MDNDEFEATMKHVYGVMDNYEAPYKGQLRDACEAIGYGRAMSLISEWWGLKLGGNGGEFVVGTCKALTVPCGCESQAHCEWCCGCGWLTEHVKGLKDKAEAKIISGVTLPDEWIDGLAKLCQLEGGHLKFTPDFDTPANHAVIEKRRKELYDE